MFEWFVIKFLHVLAGIFWLGGAILVSAFILPAVKKTGPASGAFMNNLMQVYKFPLAMNIASSLTILCGLILYWRLSSGFQHLNFQFPYGIGIFLGSVFGLIAVIFGHSFQSPNAKKLSRFLSQLQGPPSPEQAAQIGTLQKRIFIGGWIGVFLITFALIGMIMSHF